MAINQLKNGPEFYFRKQLLAILVVLLSLFRPAIADTIIYVTESGPLDPGWELFVTDDNLVVFAEPSRGLNKRVKVFEGKAQFIQEIVQYFTDNFLDKSWEYCSLVKGKRSNCDFTPVDGMQEFDPVYSTMTFHLNGIEYGLSFSRLGPIESMGVDLRRENARMMDLWFALQSLGEIGPDQFSLSKFRKLKSGLSGDFLVE